MITFLPSVNVQECARVLDVKRLGSQRREVLMVMRMCLRTTPNYTRMRNHPLVQMWQGYELALWHYGSAICTRWQKLGYKDTVQEKLAAELVLQKHSRSLLEEFRDWDKLRDYHPPWWFDDRIHSSHRATLLSKDWNFYSQFGWKEQPSVGYVYPSQLGEYKHLFEEKVNV